MEIKTKDTFWCMTDPDGVVYMDTIMKTSEACWKDFLYPGLIRKRYEEDGYKPIMYKLVQVKEKPIKRENNI